MEPDRIVLNSSVKPATNEDYATLMTFKLDLTEDATQLQKDIDPDHVRLIIRAEDGQTLIPIDHMRANDIYLPIISSAYPYFSPRNGEVGIRWKLPTLQLLIRGAPDMTDMSANGGVAFRCDEVLRNDLESSLHGPSPKRPRQDDDDDDDDDDDGDVTEDVVS
jgi:hypothetical protein